MNFLARVHGRAPDDHLLGADLVELGPDVAPEAAVADGQAHLVGQALVGDRDRHHLHQLGGPAVVGGDGVPAAPAQAFVVALGEPAPELFPPLLVADWRPSGDDTLGPGRGGVLDYGRPVDAEAAGHLGVGTARVPVGHDLDQIGHVECPPHQLSPCPGRTGRALLGGPVRETLTEGLRDYLTKRPLPLRVSVIVSTGREGGTGRDVNDRPSTTFQHRRYDFPAEEEHPGYVHVYNSVPL